MMNYWLIFRNIGAIISMFKSLSALIKEIADTRSMPSKGSIKKVIDHLQDLLDRGVIDLPNVDEKQISEVLQQLEDKLLGE